MIVVFIFFRLSRLLLSRRKSFCFFVLSAIFLVIIFLISFWFSVMVDIFKLCFGKRVELGERLNLRPVLSAFLTVLTREERNKGLIQALRFLYLIEVLIHLR